MIVPIPFVHAGLGVLVILVSLPLVLRMVPMNRVYGIRVSKAFASEQNWYQINTWGGALFLALGLFLVAFSYVTWDIAPPPTSLWAPVFLVVPLFAIIPVIVLIKALVRRLP